jgi:hypothetical protein
LGDGTNVGRPTPVQIGAATTWATASAGTAVSIVLRER